MEFLALNKITTTTYKYLWEISWDFLQNWKPGTRRFEVNENENEQREKMIGIYYA